MINDKRINCLRYKIYVTQCSKRMGKIFFDKCADCMEKKEEGKFKYENRRRQKVIASS